MAKQFIALRAAAVLALTWSLPAFGSVRLALEFHRQERSLSCEAAALTMVLRFFGIAIEEREVIREMPKETAPRRGNTWGDPNAGFVGDIDGVMGETGYGIHWGPLAHLASRWKRTAVLERGTIADLVVALDNGRPVIVWGLDGPARSISWKTPDGRKIFALSEEHTRVIYGYEGRRSSPTGFHVMDPKHGPRLWKVDELLKDWDSFGRKGIVLFR